MGKSQKSPPKQPQTGPHSRWLRIGFLPHVNGRSTEGRFLQVFTGQLIDHLGGNAEVSVTQKLLIQRAAIMAWRLQLFDEKFATGAITDYDGKLYNALNNSFRLMMRELGLKKQPAPRKTLRDYVSATHNAPQSASAP